MTCYGNTSRATVTAAFTVRAARHLVESITGKKLNVSMSYWDVTVTINSRALMGEEAICSLGLFDIRVIDKF
jgi:hypothetical protein